MSTKFSIFANTVILSAAVFTHALILFLFF